MNQLQAHIYENPKILFQYIQWCLNHHCFINVSTNEKYCVLNLPGLAVPKRTQNRNTPFRREAREVRQTHNVFFLTGGPSAVVCVCRRKCVVGKLSCDALFLRVGPCTDRLFSPCHHPLVSSLLPRICLVGRTMAPSQRQAAPTPQRCDGSKDKYTKQTSVLDLAILGRYGSHFSLHKAARWPAKKKRKTQITTFHYGRTIQLAFKSDRPDLVLGIFW